MGGLKTEKCDSENDNLENSTFWELGPTGSYLDVKYFWAKKTFLA